MGLRSGRGRCRRFRSDRFAGYFRRASTLDFSSKEVAPAVLHAERKRDVTCRDENKLSPYFFFFFYSSSSLFSSPGRIRRTRRCRRELMRPRLGSWFRGRSISGRVNIDSLGGAALVATPQG